jgi:NADH dehydrogenase FAD-containing subunit
MLDLVFIGAGHASTIVIQRFMKKKQQLRSCNVSLINEFPFAMYSGMIPGVVTQNYTINEAMLNVQNLIEALGGKFICARAQSINWDNRTITCTDSKEIIHVHFDIVIVNVGSTTRLVPGVTEFAIPTRPIAKLEERILEYEQKFIALQDIRCIVVGAGAAGVELTFCLSERFKRQLSNRTVSFTIVDTNTSFSSSLGNSSLGSRIQRIFDTSTTLDYMFNVKAEHVEQGKVHLSNGSILPFHLLIWACGAYPVELLSHLGVELDQNGFIQVNQYLQSTLHPRLFAVGDCITFCDKNIAKSGVYAVRQGPIIEENILKMINHFSKDENTSLLATSQICSSLSLQAYIPQSHFLKLINVGNKTAIAEWHGWSFGPWWILWKLKDYIDRKFMRSFPSATVSS